MPHDFFLNPQSVDVQNQRIHSGHLVVEVFPMGATHIPRNEMEFAAMKATSDFSTEPFEMVRFRAQREARQV